MPSGFAIPRREQLWMPFRIPSAGVQPGNGPLIEMSFGRLAPDATLKEAEAELQVVALRQAADHQQTHVGLRPRIAPYARSFLEADEPGLALLMRAC